MDAGCETLLRHEGLVAHMSVMARVRCRSPPACFCQVLRARAQSSERNCLTQRGRWAHRRPPQANACHLGFAELVLDLQLCAALRPDCLANDGSSQYELVKRNSGGQASRITSAPTNWEAPPIGSDQDPLRKVTIQTRQLLPKKNQQHPAGRLAAKASCG